MPISHSPYLKFAANLFATIWVGMGINAMVRPNSGLAVWEFQPPVSPEAQKLVDNLIIIYGVRDVFMGVSMYAASAFSSWKTLGWIAMSGGAVAFVDGAVSIAQIGGGQWNHWGYAPLVTIVGALLAGMAD